MIFLPFILTFVTITSQKFIANVKFSAYLQTFGNKLVTTNETLQVSQQKSFLENAEIIERHNKMNKDFELGFNDFTYMDREKFVETLCKTSLPKKLMPDRPMLTKAKKFNNFTLENLPESFSWRENLRPVKNQGGCGSCWAFATMAMLEGINKKKDKNWKHDLSPQYLVDCDSESLGCGGGWPTSALKFLKKQSKNEAPTLANYPYIDGQEKCRMTDFPKVKLNINEIFEFKFKGDEKLMRLHLVNYGPMAFAMFVNRKSGLFQLYKKGIFYEPDCPSSCQVVNHAMLLVGYGVTNDAAKKPFFLVQNSWGESWGENGYVRMAADRGNNCNIACYGMVSN